MSGRFLSKIDISSAKKEQDIRNSMRKRGEIKEPEKIVRESHVVCGCGAEGCIFIHAQRQEPEGPPPSFDAA